MLNGWRLRDREDFQLYGYVNKVKSFAWVGDAPYLATSGAYDVLCWPFDGESGPEDRDPLRVSGAGQIITVVAAVRGQSSVLVGCQNGETMLCELQETKPPVQILGSTGADVTAIAVTASLSHLFIGDAAGSVPWAPFRTSGV